VDPRDARRVWRMLEPYHAIVYFAPESREAFADLGLKGFWMGYFASRAAAMGPVPAEVVVATFFNFHPRMVHKAIPDAWHLAAVEDILATRRQAAAQALRRALGDDLDSDDVAEAAAIARRAAEAADPVGRALFAGHAALAWPDEPELVLWHAATLLREFRGDGHIAALVCEGLDGIGAHVTFAATGAVPRDVMQSSRGYTDDEWAAGEEALRRRGLLDNSGRLADAGRAMRERVEQRTDELMLPALEILGDGDAARLVELVRPLSRRIVANGGVPVPNPMGAPDPE
jgi:hypothetical protein